MGISDLVIRVPVSDGGCSRFQAFLFLCTFVPGSEKTIERTFAPVELNFRSSGANVPRTFVPMKLSYHENEYFKNFRSKCHKKHDLVAVRYVGHREFWLPWISLSHTEEATAAIAASVSIKDTALQ